MFEILTARQPRAVDLPLICTLSGFVNIDYAKYFLLFLFGQRWELLFLADLLLRG